MFFCMFVFFWRHTISCCNRNLFIKDDKKAYSRSPCDRVPETVGLLYSAVSNKETGDTFGIQFLPVYFGNVDATDPNIRRLYMSGFVPNQFLYAVKGAVFVDTRLSV